MSQLSAERLCSKIHANILPEFNQAIDIVELINQAAKQIIVCILALVCSCIGL